MTSGSYHLPVLLRESVGALDIKPGGIYVDVTFGGGGHSREILKHLNEEGKLFAFDADPDAQANIIPDDRFELIPENFRYMKNFLRMKGVRKVDGILADLGVSSYQFNKAERGFSTRFDAVLDMRMSQQGKDAREVVNTYDEGQLTYIFRNYGELKQARKIAARITSYRKDREIDTTEELLDILEPFLRGRNANKTAAKIFQALRIEVNDELEALKEFLLQTPGMLKEGGRLCVIAYHSLEDRLVKRFIRNGMFEGEPERDIYGNYEVPFRKIGKLIVPSQEEIETNKRSRSAKLRVAERI